MKFIMSLLSCSYIHYSLKLALTEKSSGSDQMQKFLSDKDNHIKELKEKIYKLESDIAERNATIQTKDSSIEENVSLVKQTKDKLKEKDQECATLNSQINQVRVLVIILGSINSTGFTLPAYQWLSFGQLGD